MDLETMTTAISSDQLESRLALLSQVSLKIRGHHSIEVQPNLSPNAYISYTRDSWGQDNSEFVTEICREFGLQYKVVPLNNKLAVTIF